MGLYRGSTFQILPAVWVGVTLSIPSDQRILSVLCKNHIRVYGLGIRVVSRHAQMGPARNIFIDENFSCYRKAIHTRSQGGLLFWFRV